MTGAEARELGKEMRDCFGKGWVPDFEGSDWRQARRL